MTSFKEFVLKKQLTKETGDKTDNISASFENVPQEQTEEKIFSNNLKYEMLKKKFLKKASEGDNNGV